jgi:hypothetical protein
MMSSRPITKLNSKPCIILKLLGGRMEYLEEGCIISNYLDGKYNKYLEETWEEELDTL